jgi:hypothetical protein
MTAIINLVILLLVIILLPVLVVVAAVLVDVCSIVVFAVDPLLRAVARGSQKYYHS